MPLKGPARTYSLTDSFTLSSSSGTAVQKVPGTYGEELKHLTSGQDLEEEAFSQTEVLAGPLFLC